MLSLGGINNSNQFYNIYIDFVICNSSFIIYRWELLIPPSNTMSKLLVILFVIKLYARINISSDMLLQNVTLFSVSMVVKKDLEYVESISWNERCVYKALLA